MKGCGSFLEGIGEGYIGRLHNVGIKEVSQVMKGLSKSVRAVVVVNSTSPQDDALAASTLLLQVFWQMK